MEVIKNKKPVSKKSVLPKKKNLKVAIDSLAEVHISATFNNIIISITNRNGDLITWSSAGKSGFKGSKKNTPYAAKCAAEQSCQKAYELGVRRAKVLVNGPGLGRESAIRTIETSGITIESIVDNTRLPYNGCRPPKRRRT